VDRFLTSSEGHTSYVVGMGMFHTLQGGEVNQVDAHDKKIFRNC
jgi:hypothetical protein